VDQGINEVSKAGKKAASVTPGGEKKSILVTGGSGFIGTHLVRALAQAGHEVTVLDLKAPALSVRGVKYLVGDVREDRDLARLVPSVDAVYHLAAIVSVPECQADPLGSFETNTRATLKILELIRKSKRARFIFASSSAVYGDLGHQNPIAETTPLTEPASFYGAQKLTSEQWVRLYAKTHGIRGTVFRFFNVYGSGQKADSPYSGVISLFVKRLRDGQPLLLNGGGEQTRDFVAVADVVSALVRALSTENAEVLAGAPLNLGSGSATRIKELAELLASFSERRPVIESAPARSGDILYSCADIARAERELAWRPQVKLAHGLRELWAAPA
jgi:UDP-glucose 4-epimerase